MPSSAGANAAPVHFLVDGHVHIYECMPVERLVDAAGRNFAGCAGAEGMEHNGVLFVADPDGVRGFERLREYGNGNRTADHENWRLDDDESRSFTLRRSGGRRITVIQGQQLITQEGLELLSIGCSRSLAPGLPLTTTIDRVRAADGWSIIAWGVGKWFGRRGRVVTDMIAAEGGRDDVMLGDNGGRPRLWSRVPQFREAMERGMRILAGTDPLPLKGEEDRVGSYAFVLRGIQDDGRSRAQVLRQALLGQDAAVRTVGEPVGTGKFLSNQLRLRLQTAFPGT